MILRRNRTVALLAAAMAMFATAGGRADSIATSVDGVSSSRLVRGLGKPSDESRVSFEGNNEGNSVIKQVMVQPGDLVKSGDVLMVEDSAQAQAELAVLKAASEATGAAEEAQVTIDSENMMMEKYHDASLGNRQEVDYINAQRERDVATSHKKQALEEQQQRLLSYQRQKLKIDHMTLHSPIDGIVQSVSLHAGEVVDANSDKEGACYVIENDPLWVELQDVPASQASKLTLHDKVDVAFEAAPGEWRGGEVIFLDPQVDPATQTRVIRISVANPDHKPSGMRMIVRLPEKAAAPEAVGMAR